MFFLNACLNRNSYLNEKFLTDQGSGIRTIIFLQQQLEQTSASVVFELAQGLQYTNMLRSHHTIMIDNVCESSESLSMMKMMM